MRHISYKQFKHDDIRHIRGSNIIKHLMFLMGILIITVYFTGLLYYSTHYYPNTRITGMAAGNMTIDEAVNLIDKHIQEYHITIHSIEDFDFTPEVTYNRKDLRDMLHKQHSYLWFIYCFKDYDRKFEYKVDKDNLCNNLNQVLFDEEVHSQDAYIEKTDEGFKIIPEVYGNIYLDKDKVYEEIYECVCSFKDTVDTSKYLIKPEITADNNNLNRLCRTANNLSSGEYYYQFGDDKEELTAIDVMIDEGQVTINTEKLKDYIKGLSVKTDTLGKSHKFKTTDEDEIEISGGDYGWKIDQEATYDKLLENILAGKTGEQEIVFTQEADSFKGNDYGNTYVEVNLSKQHLWYYKDGKVITDCDVVTGTPPDNSTLPGIYRLKYKKSDTYLEGDGYKTHVDYWMPFDEDRGLHDAQWRSEFGNSIYKTNGSHGCVNMPLANAEIIYKNISENTAVIVY